MSTENANGVESMIQRMIDDTVVYLLCDKYKRIAGGKRIPLSSICPVIPLTEKWMDMSSDEGKYFADVKPRDLDYHWSFGSIKDSEGEWEKAGSTYTALRVRTLPRTGIPHLRAEVVVAGLYPDGHYETQHAVFRWRMGGWQPQDGGGIRRDSDGCYAQYCRTMPAKIVAIMTRIINGSMMFAFTEQYDWSIVVGLPSGLSLKLPTDATGIKAIIESRDDGTSGRRDALVRWVSDHWRQLRHDPDVETYVRRHLRGAQQFGWRGYQCRIIVPPAEQRENQKLTEQRAQMRREGVDRRLAAHP